MVHISQAKISVPFGPNDIKSTGEGGGGVHSGLEIISLLDVNVDICCVLTTKQQTCDAVFDQ